MKSRIQVAVAQTLQRFLMHEGMNSITQSGQQFMETLEFIVKLDLTHIIRLQNNTDAVRLQANLSSSGMPNSHMFNLEQPTFIELEINSWKIDDSSRQFSFPALDLNSGDETTAIQSKATLESVRYSAIFRKAHLQDSNQKQILRKRPSIPSSPTSSSKPGSSNYTKTANLKVMAVNRKHVPFAGESPVRKSLLRVPPSSEIPPNASLIQTPSVPPQTLPPYVASDALRQSFRCACNRLIEYRGLHEIEMHIKDKHRLGKPYHCTLCGNKFYNRFQFMSHGAEIHQKLFLLLIELLPTFMIGEYAPPGIVFRMFSTNDGRYFLCSCGEHLDMNQLIRHPANCQMLKHNT